MQVNVKTSEVMETRLGECVCVIGHQKQAHTIFGLCSFPIVTVSSSPFSKAFCQTQQSQEEIQTKQRG